MMELRRKLIAKKGSGNGNGPNKISLHEICEQPVFISILARTALIAAGIPEPAGAGLKSVIMRAD